MSILIFTVEFISFYYGNMNIFDIPIHTTVTQFVWVTCDIDGSKMQILAKLRAERSKPYKTSVSSGDLLSFGR